MWIDVFFFRAAAMIPDGQRMILNVEDPCDKVPTGPSSNTYPLGHIN